MVDNVGYSIVNYYLYILYFFPLCFQ